MLNGLNKMENNNLIVRLLVAPPASGKTTYAHNFIKENTNWVIVSRDSIRFMLKNSPVLNKTGESLVTEILNFSILAALESNYNVLVDNTNLRQVHIESLYELVKCKADLQFHRIEINIDECFRRDELREKKVGKDVIIKMFNDLDNLLKTFDFSPRKKLIQ